MVYIRAHNAIVSSLTIGIVGASIYVAKKLKEEQHLKKINLQVKHAKDTLASNKVCGSWIMKKNNENDYIGAINVLDNNNNIKDHYFEISSNYKFKWVSELQEDY
ncbi:hypothetical protein AP1H75_09320 [Apilactobacillus apinorum]